MGEGPGSVAGGGSIGGGDRHAMPGAQRGAASGMSAVSRTKSASCACLRSCRCQPAADEHQHRPGAEAVAAPARRFGRTRDHGRSKALQRDFSSCGGWQRVERLVEAARILGAEQHADLQGPPPGCGQRWHRVRAAAHRAASAGDRAADGSCGGFSGRAQMRRQLRGQDSDRQKPPAAASPSEHGGERLQRRGDGFQRVQGRKISQGGVEVHEQPGAERLHAEQRQIDAAQRPSKARHSAQTVDGEHAGRGCRCTCLFDFRERLRQEALVAKPARALRRQPAGLVGVLRQRGIDQHQRPLRPVALPSTCTPQCASSASPSCGASAARPSTTRLRLPPKVFEAGRLHADQRQALR